MLSKKIIALLLSICFNSLLLAEDDSPKTFKKSSVYGAVALSTALLAKRSTHYTIERIKLPNFGLINKTFSAGFSCFAIGSALYYSQIAFNYIYDYCEQKLKEYKNKKASAQSNPSTPKRNDQPKFFETTD